MEDQQVSAEDVKRVLAAEFDQLAEAVAKAMHSAHAGRIISDTEEPVRQANAVFREQVYEKAIRLLQNRPEAFSPSTRRTPEQRPARPPT
jgi:hypothetical protein